MRTASFLLLFAIVSPCFSQTDLAIGQWKSHLPYAIGIYVTQSEGRVFYATTSSLLILDKADNAIERVSKVEGLSQVGISLVKYNMGSQTLLIVYDNGVIDLVGNDGSIQTLPNIPESNIVLGEKKIFDVLMANDSIAYLSANYGITTLNLRRGLFPNTVKTPVEVRNVQVFQNQLFAATPEGIYTADPAAGYNLDDFSNWNLLDSAAGFPQDYSSKTMVVFNGKLYADVNDSLYVFDGQSASLLHHEAGFSIKYLTAEGVHLLAGFKCNGDCWGKMLAFNADHTFQQAGGDCAINPFYAIEDAQGKIWYANADFRVAQRVTDGCPEIKVNGPWSTRIQEIAVFDHQVYLVSGGFSASWTALGRLDGLSVLANGTWTAHNPFTQPALSGQADFFNVVVHPQTKKVYVGAGLNALIAYDPAAGGYEIFNQNNSSLLGDPGDNNRSKVTGLALDKQGNLWMCNTNAPKPLSVLRTDGTWKNFAMPCTGDKGFVEIAIDDFGNKWLMSTNAGLGLVVFNEGDFDDPSDDQCRVLNEGNSALPNNEISAIEVDLDGSIWVGTKNGAMVFQCDPLRNNCPGSRPFVTVDGFGANLLEETDVRAIGVDGANRKWFGTNTGVFVMSPDGSDQIARFTAENSPLFDNNIQDIAFDQQTGEVYIGTQKGLISYRSDATAGGSVNSNDVLVFPNPVRPEYEGPIAIKGLAQDATVKITDVSGQLVFETTALGGQAIWNGRDYNGRKANTGVYLVFATSRNSSDPDVAVAKILLIN